MSADPSVSSSPLVERETWYFTFGFAHRHAGCYFVVKDATLDEAREEMFAKFGREWAFQYDDTGWHKHGVSQAEKWGLTEIA